MAVLALVRDHRSIKMVLPWASALANARDGSMIVVCFTESAVPSTEMEDPGPVSQDLVEATQDFIRHANIAVVEEVIGLSGPSEAQATIAVAREKDIKVIIAAGADPSGQKGGTYASNALLKQSPCTTLILFGDATRSTKPKTLFVGASDNAHDIAATLLANQLAVKFNAQLTMAVGEFESGPAGEEIGRRDLDQLMRDAGVEDMEAAECKVFQTGAIDEASAVMDSQDLVMLGANYEHLPAILELTEKPTVAIVKRAPPLRAWQGGIRESIWNSRLSPADYAELIQGLRRGSKLGVDFVTMLSLATVVASLGLLQDSAAVVIGSMLLAPLMTPMIGGGLALAQANPKLGRTALITVAAGLVCTLVISYLIGIITPGTELTSQIYARGQPTILDLLIAVASAAAASFALARPNLVGSIAGVAIATALVPPLCSVGISIAYGDFANAQGAALLFVTNFLAIVLASAMTFRLIGITAKQAGTRQRFWVFRMVAILSIAIIVVTIPLQQAMKQSLVLSKPQPRAFPLAKTVMDAVEERLASRPEFELITAGQPSSHFALSDVTLLISTTGEPDIAFFDELREVIRTEMLDDTLKVKIHCVKAFSDEASPGE